MVQPGELRKLSLGPEIKLMLLRPAESGATWKKNSQQTQCGRELGSHSPAASLWLTQVAGLTDFGERVIQPYSLDKKLMPCLQTLAAIELCLHGSVLVFYNSMSEWWH